MLTGCSDEGGQASPVTNQPGPNTATGAPPAGEDPFAGIDRCEILDQALEGEGLPPGEVATVVREKGCDVDKRRSMSLGFVLDSGARYDEVQADPSEVFDGAVNGRPAVLVKFKHVERDCAISMQVTAESHAFLVVALYEGTREEACGFATKVMGKIEPQLPKG
ncbi:MAG: DUF3558 family protein [Haloechinothrix sp.]